MRGALRLGLVLAVLAAGLVALAHHLAAPTDRGLVPVTSAPHAPGVGPTRAPGAAPGAPAGAGPQVDPAWLQRTAARTELPETALRAYATASLRAPRGCGLGWTTLAAIGWVESHHGTLGARVLRLDGTSSSPVLGPALDGRPGFRAIPATAAGVGLHGDATWEHAVGPMQFLPGTWAAWSADGDRDGTRSPLDLDDAALGAARYLCGSGRDLTTGAGWSGGVFSYNRSQTYLDDVHAAATAYAERAGG